MKILSYLEGATTISSPWEEVRPIAGLPPSIVLEALRARYGFSTAGFSAAGQQGGFFTPHMQLGKIDRDGYSISINSLEFQPSSVTVVSSKTEFSDYGLQDIFDFLTANLGFRRPSGARKVTHQSTIIFSPDEADTEDAFGKWNDVLRFVNSKIKQDEGNYSGWGFKFANGEIGGAGENQLIIEKRAISPPNENWWFSRGQFDSMSHTQILEYIERIFPAQKSAKAAHRK